MKNILIEGKKDTYFTPNIDFNAQSGRCEISGESYLEDTRKFYSPLWKWIDQYATEVGNPLFLNMRLTYFNTSSSRAILDLLSRIKEYEDDGGKVTVNWYYAADDLDMEEEIEDYIYDTDLKINKNPI